MICISACYQLFKADEAEKLTLIDFFSIAKSQYFHSFREYVTRIISLKEYPVSGLHDFSAVTDQSNINLFFSLTTIIVLVFVLPAITSRSTFNGQCGRRC